MTNSVPTVAQMVISSVSSPDPTNPDRMLTDPELLYWRLNSVKGDNYSAFVKALMDFLSWGMSADKHTTPSVAAQIKSDVSRIVRDYKVAMSAQSGEDGLFTNQLLRDSVEQILTIKGDKKSAMEKLKNFQGQNQQQEVNQQ